MNRITAHMHHKGIPFVEDSPLELLLAVTWLKRKMVSSVKCRLVHDSLRNGLKERSEKS